MRTRKMTDRMLLEGLVNKYGVKRLTNTINEMAKYEVPYDNLVKQICNVISSGKIKWELTLGDDHSYRKEEIFGIIEDFEINEYNIELPYTIFGKYITRNSWGDEWLDRVTGPRIYPEDVTKITDKNNNKIELSKKQQNEIKKCLKLYWSNIKDNPDINWKDVGYISYHN